MPQGKKPANKKKSTGSQTKTENAKSLTSLKRELVRHTDAYCKALLNQEYQQMCRVMIRGLCVKNSPALRGNIQTWAAAIVGAIGYVNELHNRKMKPYIARTTFINKLHVDAKTYQKYLKILIDGFDLIPYDPDFTLPSLIPANPLIAAACSPSLLQEDGGWGTCCDLANGFIQNCTSGGDCCC